MEVTITGMYRGDYGPESATIEVSDGDHTIELEVSQPDFWKKDHNFVVTVHTEATVAWALRGTPPINT